MSSYSVLNITFLVTCFLIQSIFCASPSPSIEEGCKGVFAKLGICFPYVSGKPELPSKNCCSTVQAIKEQNVICLCFIIQQTHAGAPSLKQLGLQVPRLIQLPTVCKLVNVTVSRCAKDLKLSPDSPDYGIFTNSSSYSPAAGTSMSGKKDDSSIAFVHQPLLISSSTVVIPISVAIFILVFPM